MNQQTDFSNVKYCISLTGLYVDSSVTLLTIFDNLVPS